MSEHKKQLSDWTDLFYGFVFGVQVTVIVQMLLGII